MDLESSLLPFFPPISFGSSFKWSEKVPVSARVFVLFVRGCNNKRSSECATSKHLLDLLLLLLKRHHRATTRRLGFRHEEEENAMRMKELWSLAYQQSRRRMLLGWRERERERFIHVLNPKLLLLLLFLLLIFSPVSFLVAMMPMQMNLRTNPADPPPPLR